MFASVTNSPIPPPLLPLEKRYILRRLKKSPREKLPHFQKPLEATFRDTPLARYAGVVRTRCIDDGIQDSGHCGVVGSDHHLVGVHPHSRAEEAVEVREVRNDSHNRDTGDHLGHVIILLSDVGVRDGVQAGKLGGIVVDVEYGTVVGRLVVVVTE